MLRAHGTVLTRRALTLALTLAIATLGLGGVSAAQERPSRPTPGFRVRIAGVVFDSIAQRPLSDAVVQLVAADDPSRRRSTRSDSAGRYVLDSITEGVYLLGLLHDRLDTLGIDGPLRRIDVQAAGDIDAPLAIPSVSTFIVQRCGPGAPGQARTLFMGSVRSAMHADTRAGRPSDSLVAVRVRAQWPEVVVGPKGIERRSPVRFVNATAAGAFAFCDMPTDVPITSRAFAGADSSGVVELRVPTSGLLLRDLFVGSATRVASAGASPTSATSVLRGSGRVRGSVRSTTGTPISGARLVLWGTGVEATSNANGQFSLQDLPFGTYTLESRALGFQPVRVAIDLLERTEPSSESAVDVAMAIAVATIDTVRVRARANNTVPLAEFERRRKTGFGHFLDEAQVLERRAMYVADLFRRTPGMTILPGQAGNDQVLMRSSGGGGSCIPALFVNGLMVPNTDGVLDTYVNPAEVRAVEIYSRVASVPLQFESRTGCGSIVLWTGARSAPTPRR